VPGLGLGGSPYLGMVDFVPGFCFLVTTPEITSQTSERHTGECATRPYFPSAREDCGKDNSMASKASVLDSSRARYRASQRGHPRLLICSSYPVNYSCAGGRSSSLSFDGS
jgi:hypothetical protein